MKEKIKVIYLPFLIWFFGILAGYSLFNWLFFIKAGWIPVQESVTLVVFPLALSAVFAWIIMRPRMKALLLKTKKGSLLDFYCVVIWLMSGLTMVLAQHLLTTASGKLTVLNSINDIPNHNHSKYYRLKLYYIEKERMSIQASSDVSGRYNEHFNMHIYVALRILKQPQDTILSMPWAWYGLVYHKTISNRLDENEKSAEYLRFTQECQKKFDETNVAGYKYLDRIGNSDTRNGLVQAIKNGMPSRPDPVILVPVFEPFEARNGKKPAWLGAVLIAVPLIFLFMVFVPKADSHILNQLQSGLVEKESRKAWLAILLPREGFFITPVIIYLNVLVFGIMVLAGLGFINFSAEDLLHWGGNFRPSTTNGQWWRLFTSIFLHGGIMHLFANMYGLMFVGIFLEPAIGRYKYLIVYLVSGILASIASLAWHEATVSVGASGAIFGLYGVFLALLLTGIFPKEFSQTFLISTLIFIGYNLVMGFSGGIDNAAHVGGLLTGFMIGLMLSLLMKRRKHQSGVGPE